MYSFLFKTLYHYIISIIFKRYWIFRSLFYITVSLLVTDSLKEKRQIHFHFSLLWKDRRCNTSVIYWKPRSESKGISVFISQKLTLQFWGLVKSTSFLILEKTSLTERLEEEYSNQPCSYNLQQFEFVEQALPHARKDTLDIEMKRFVKNSGERNN